MVEITRADTNISPEKSDNGEDEDNPGIIKPVPIEPEWIGFSWYVALVRQCRTPPNAKREDVKALEAIQALGVPAWYAVMGRRRRCDGKGGIQKPRYSLAFPGYLFVAHTGDHHRLVKILQVRHIVGLLGYDNAGIISPLRLSGADIGSLFAGEGMRLRDVALEFDQETRLQEMKNNPPEIGESVEVLDSGFGKFDARIEGLISASRVQVLRKILGSERLVDIPLDKIRRK